MLVRLNLHLELWSYLHVWVSLIVIVGPVDCFDSRLKNFDVVSWVISEALYQHIIKSMQVVHVHLKEVIASLSIALELFSVYKNIVYLSLSDEMHKFILGLGKTLLVLIAHVNICIDQILISEINLVSVKCHLIFFKI